MVGALDEADGHPVGENAGPLAQLFLRLAGGDPAKPASALAAKPATRIGPARRWAAARRTAIPADFPGMDKVARLTSAAGETGWTADVRTEDATTLVVTVRRGDASIVTTLTDGKLARARMPLHMNAADTRPEEPLRGYSPRMNRTVAVLSAAVGMLAALAVLLAVLVLHDRQAIRRHGNPIGGDPQVRVLDANAMDTDIAAQYKDRFLDQIQGDLPDGPAGQGRHHLHLLGRR